MTKFKNFLILLITFIIGYIATTMALAISNGYQLVQPVGLSMFPYLGPKTTDVIKPVNINYVKNHIGRAYAIKIDMISNNQIDTIEPDNYVIKFVIAIGPAFVSDVNNKIIVKTPNNKCLSYFYNGMYFKGVYLNPNELFLLGGNYNYSVDSRSYGTIIPNKIYKIVNVINGISLLSKLKAICNMANDIISNDKNPIRLNYKKITC